MSGVYQDLHKQKHASPVSPTSLARSSRYRARLVRLGRRLPRIAIAVSLSLLPWLVVANDGPQKQREENQKRLNEMTVTERQRLDENYRRYREMPAAELDRLRDLHQAIESDPELKAAFQKYEAWANSLSPLERHELRNARDLEERRSLIEKYRRGSPRREVPPDSERRPGGPQPFGPNLIGRGERPRLLEKLFGRNVPLGGDRLASFVPEMEAIIHVLDGELPPEAKAELSDVDPFARKVRVVRLTLERHPMGPPAVRIFGPPNSGTFDRVIAELPEGQIKQFAMNRNPLPLAQRNMLLMALIRGLMTEMQRQIEDHRPGAETLRRYHDKLSESERRRLAGLNREDQQLELQQLYLKEQVPGIAELQRLVSMPEMERYFQDMIGQMRGGPILPEGDERRGPRGRPPFDEGNGRPREPDFPPPNRRPPNESDR